LHILQRTKYLTVKTVNVRIRNVMNKTFKVFVQLFSFRTLPIVLFLFKTLNFSETGFCLRLPFGGNRIQFPNYLRLPVDGDRIQSPKYLRLPDDGDRIQSRNVSVFLMTETESNLEMFPSSS
jgi:hypothetical protein